MESHVHIDTDFHITTLVHAYSDMLIMKMGEGYTPTSSPSYTSHFGAPGSGYWGR